MSNFENDMRTFMGKIDERTKTAKEAQKNLAERLDDHAEAQRISTEAILEKIGTKADTESVRKCHDRINAVASDVAVTKGIMYGFQALWGTVMGFLGFGK